MIGEGSRADGGAGVGMAEAQDPTLPASPPNSPMVPPPAAPAQELSPVEQFAQEVRTNAKWGPAVDVNVRGLMASGIMAGQPVHIQLKHKDPVYLQGGQPISLLSFPSCSQPRHLCMKLSHSKAAYIQARDGNYLASCL